MTILRTAIALSAMFVALMSTGISLAGPFEDGIAAYDQGKFEKALKLWLPLAEQGSVAAQYNVAALYEKGSGVGVDSAQAAHWYLEAAKQGDIDAELKIANLYAAGTGVAKDPAEARKWYTALIASPHNDKAALAAKQQARQRLASVMGVTQEVVAYDAGRFVIVRSSSGTCLIALQGMITMDARYKFDDVVERSAKLGCIKPSLMLESPGGLLEDGIRIGNEVRNQGFQTITRYDCASACAIVFLGGVERTLVGSRAAIGLHQPSTFRANGKDHRCSNVVQEGGVLAMRRYLADVIPATSDQVMDVSMQTACTSIEWVKGQRAIDMGIATRVESAGADVFGPKSARR